MRALIPSFILLAAALPGLGQAAASAGPGLPKDPLEVLAEAAPFYDFKSAALKPWHMKATYQLYDVKGDPTEQGTYEYWWASPKVRRSSWTRADATRTDWWTADGAQYRKESGKPLRFFERRLSTVLLAPLPDRALLEAGRLKLELKSIPVGQWNLSCISATLQPRPDGKPLLQGPDPAQYYCFEPLTMAVRMTHSSAITTEYGQVVKTQDRYLARQVAVSAGKQKIISISVEKTDGMDSLDRALTPAADAALVPAAVTQIPTGQTESGLAKGLVVKKTLPVYPATAQGAREQGVVVIGATIGTDGRIHDAEVLASPSQLLAESAVAAVKQWQYTPLLRNGVAVEVETVVNVNFILGK
ncbi:MAG: energy transducer TonB [Terracidiphilus sp.]|nr:energy transducer TonB [Terracidiphilus sp.]